jgi:hypothetical protein
MSELHFIILAIDAKQKRIQQQLAFQMHLYKQGVKMIAVGNLISKNSRTKRLIEKQEHKVNVNIIYCDNTSFMKLENNKKSSSGNCTQHFNIKYLYI